MKTRMVQMTKLYYQSSEQIRPLLYYFAMSEDFYAKITQPFQFVLEGTNTIFCRIFAPFFVVAVLN